MNKQINFALVLLLLVVLSVGIFIGVAAGTFLFDLAFPTESTSGTLDSESTSDSQTSDQTTAAVNKPVDQTPKKKIAITFDDGPSTANTNAILDLLEQYNAKATFFVCGERLTISTKSTLQRTIALGCEIGNHTVSHKYLTQISEAEILQEIKETNEKISQYSGTNYKCIFYRPPGGFINRSVMDTLYNNGISMYSIMWSSDSLDWQYQSRYNKGEITRAEAIEGAFDTIVRETTDGTVILMHDIHGITVDVLKLVLEKYTAEGYEFVTVSELFGLEDNGSEEAYFNRYYSENRITPTN